MTVGHPRRTRIRSSAAAARELRGAQGARRRSLSARVRADAHRSTSWSTPTARGPARSSTPSASRPTTAGRILAIRSFGKANFLVISDGAAQIQVYIRQDALPERDFKIFKLLDFGDFVGVRGHLFRTKTNELTIWASGLEFLAKCFMPLPEKWHGLSDVEIRYRQRYLDLIVNPDSRRVFEVRSRVLASDPRVPQRARLPRGRDADDAADRRRRAGAAVRDASQRARHAALPAHRAGAVPEAADRRRARAGLRDQPQLPERGDLDAAQPRVHDAGVLPGLQRLPRADGDDRGDARDRRARGDRHRPDHVRRAPDLAGAAVPPRLAARGRARGGVASVWASRSPTPTCAIARPAAAIARRLGIEVRRVVGRRARSPPRSSSV